MSKAIEPDPGAGDQPDVVRNADGEVVPTLRGELVTLRPIRPADRDALLEVLRDPSVVAVWDTRGPETSVDEILAGDKGWTPFAIEVGGEFAGSIQCSEQDADGDYRHAGIDIFMRSRFQGRGIGTDAVRTLARYLLEVRGHHRLTIDPAADNVRAIRTYEKVGFKPVGVMRRYERGRDGTYHDGLLMDMLAGELR
jgi:aminoglycoside 6'-N-acetyltransferase